MFGTIEEAQVHEMDLLLSKMEVVTPNISTVSQFILNNKKNFVDILTTNTNSKPKARLINGGSKKRTAKVVITDADGSIDSPLNAIS